MYQSIVLFYVPYGGRVPKPLKECSTYRSTIGTVFFWKYRTDYCSSVAYYAGCPIPNSNRTWKKASSATNCSSICSSQGSHSTADILPN